MARLRELIARLENGNALVSYAVQYGFPEDVASTYANRFQADLVILDSERAAGRWKWRPGAFESHLVNQIGADVLIVAKTREQRKTCRN